MTRGGGGDACLVLCLCLPVPWWNAESHERGPLSLSRSLRLVSCVCLKSATVPLLTHYLSADLPPAPKTHTATNACENTQMQSWAGPGLCTRTDVPFAHIKFLSNRKSEVRSKQTENPIILRLLNYYDYLCK